MTNKINLTGTTNGPKINRMKTKTNTKIFWKRMTKFRSKNICNNLFTFVFKNH